MTTSAVPKEDKQNTLYMFMCDNSLVNTGLLILIALVLVLLYKLFNQSPPNNSLSLTATPM